MFAAFFMTACAQDDKANSEIPSVVLNAFESRFDNPTNTDWEMNGQDYEVEFDLKNVEHTALLNESGELFKYKKDIMETDLPEAVRTALQNEFSDKKFDDFDLLVSGDMEYYQIEIDGTLRDKEVVFTASGEMTTEIPVWD
ncbi:hypothetical protein GCM10011532_22900 [Christiangramia forsetii]|nr:hypothetical protein GCM10011532_22900 [Christiangramia forsetii]